MSSKDKENKSLQDKLKQYFKFNKGGTGNFKSRTDFALSTDLERELGSDTPINKRLKAIKDLTEDVLNNRLEDKGVEKLWLCLRDLLQPDQPKEHRHLVFAFLRSLIQGQYEQLTIMRGHFFRVIKDHNVAGDIQPRFEMLQTLTENGKDIKNFEEEIGQFMLEWMPNIVSPLPIQDFLLMIVNLVKFNATYLDEEIVAGFVNNTCYLCCYSGSPQVVMACLQVLEAIVCYSIFPHDALHTFVAALCRTVNVEQYCQTSWKIMRNVLGTDLGHAALFVMCTALSNNAAGDAGLTRGAVFYINMALWGAKRVNTLRATHASVLPSFLSALDGNQSVVTYEVILALQSLINRHGRELHEPAWDIVFKILSKIISQIEQMPTPNPLIVSHLHETITSVEQLVEVRAFNGDIETMFTVIDRCGHTRPEQSVLKLIAHRAAQIVPMRHDWLSALAGLVERYCRQETRVAVRLHILLMLQRIVQLNRNGFEEELLDRVVLPNLQHCSSEADPTIRCASAKLLVELATQCHSKGCGGLLDILEKLLNRQFELYVTNEAISLPVDSNISDIRTVVHGLVKIFHSKLFKLSANHSVKVYLIMVKHLELHYGRPSLFENHPFIRMKILEFFLSARANTYCHIGFCYDAVGNPISASNAANPASRDKPSFSPYVCVEGGTAVASDGSSRVVGAHSPVAHGQVNVSYVSVRKACKLIIACLTQERDWAVLSLVLGEIPSIMQNKALILPKHNNDIDMLATALCAMVADKSLNLPESLRVTSGTKLMKSDFHTAVLGVLACLAPYHTNLDPQTQQKIIKCLIKFGLCERPTVSRLPQQCITALTIFTLEMRDTMVKLLPDVLLELSKISASPPIAGPMLEFLSTLTRLPKVFASFVADQYMSVFAILLPYTNPSRYNHYIVSLAHHVIAAWFLKCRLNYRRDFVKFIIHGLHNFILLPVEEKFKRPEFTTNMNEDSSNRKRSSSLTEQGSRRREPPSRATLASATGELGKTRGGDSAANMAFHLELTETCIDLMARYTFSPCSVKPKRLATADFMFSGGQSVTWLVGHKLITITTSGCLQNPLKQGLCDRCLTLCKQHIESLPSPQALVPGFAGAMVDPNEQARYDGSNSEIKRYTKYTLQHSRSNETSSSSFSMSDNSLQLPSMSSGQTTRQNSSENKSQSSDAPGQPTSPKIINEGCDSQTQLSLKLESLAKQSWEDRPSCKRMWSRLERLLGSGATSGLSEERPHCACWCSGWAEVHVRRPTGDVSWVMRMQNQMSFDSMSESPLNDIIALLAPTLQGGSPYFGPHGMQPGPSSSNSSGLGDSRNDILSDGSPRSRSGSTASRGAPPVLAAPPPDLQKSSSDSVVAPGAEKRPPHASTHCIVPVPTQNVLRSHMTTEPINIPGSPQRQNSSSTNTDEDDYQATVGADSTQAEDQGKSRHPVRRSNSSPEMSSSWKSPFHLRERLDAAQELRSDDIPPADDAGRVPEARYTELSAVPHHLQKKVGKNKDMRVSCEAIPEEIYGGSGTTPPSVPPHPHLMTYNSDPGTTKADQAATQATPASQQNITQVSSDTAINTLVQKAGPTDPTKSALKSDKPTDLTIRTQDSFKLSGKPPQAPAPPSPRLVGRGAGPPPPGKPERTVNLKVNDKVTGFSSDDLPPLSRSKRSNTISVMSPTRKRRDNPSPKSRESSRLGGGGVTPPFVLLQLYHNMGVGSGQNNLYGTAGSSGTLGSGLGAGGPGGSSTNTPWVEKPLLVSGVQHERSVKTLDLVPPLETYKVGVLYVGPGQHDNETKILKNEFGSLRYAEFLHDLGSLIALEDADKYGLFLNVEKGGRDGHFTYVWQDDIMQLHFHVATLMPNNSSDPTCIEKRKHIGNDFVSIVYNDSGEDFQIHTIKGQFNFCIVVIEPLEHGINRVTIKSKDDRIKSKFFNQMESKIISDQNVALLARQLALHCNLASLISRSLTSSDSPPYASNSLERLRIIKRLRARLIQERTNSGENAYYSSTYSSDLKRMNMDDFTEYT